MDAEGPGAGSSRGACEALGLVSDEDVQGQGQRLHARRGRGSGLRAGAASSSSSATKSSVAVAPIYIGRDNAAAALGRTWRATQDLAAELGVKPRKVGRIALYPAAELVAAIEARAAIQVVETSEPETDMDELAVMRERVRRAG